MQLRLCRLWRLVEARDLESASVGGRSASGDLLGASKVTSQRLKILNGFEYDLSLNAWNIKIRNGFLLHVADAKGESQ
jgi:hypothetical protein